MSYTFVNHNKAEMLENYKILRGGKGEIEGRIFMNCTCPWRKINLKREMVLLLMQLHGTEMLSKWNKITRYEERAKFFKCLEVHMLDLFG